MTLWLCDLSSGFVGLHHAGMT